MSYIVCIEGNIASGKTTVLQELEKKGYKVFYEPYKDNLYLPLFYQNPPKYALVTQLEFLSDRYKQFKSAETVGNDIAFIERSPYTDRFVFVEMLRRQGTLQDKEVELYKKVFEPWKIPFPQFTEKLNSFVSDSLLQMWIDEAKERISPSDFGNAWKYVISLYVAHNVVKYLEKVNPNKDVVKNAQTKGFQTSKSADGLSASYDIGSALTDYNGWGTLKETEYGRELIDRLKSLKAGVFYIS